MKYLIKYKVILLAMLFIGLSSCTDDLDVIPEDDDFSNAEDYFQTEGAYKAYLGKLYAGFAVSGPNGAGSSDIQGLDAGFGQYMRAYFLMQEVPTDEAILGWTGDAGVPEMSSATWTPINAFINAMYLRVLYQATITTEFLRQTTDEKLESRGVSGTLYDEIQTYRAEARFIRALAYSHGVDLFGKIAFVDENSPTGTYFFPNEISRSDLFNFIETELLAVESELSEPTQVEYGRADKAAAWMLLAKLYMNAEVYVGQNRYSDAMTYINQVINSGYSINTAVPYQYLFLADNNTNGAQSEVIFPVLSDGISLQSYGSTTFITHAAVGGDMSPADFGIDGGWGGLRTRPEFVNKFSDTSGASDSRAMFFTDNQTLDIGAIGPSFQQGYAITKFKNVTSSGVAGVNATFVDIDYPMFRLADAYLMYAECALRGAGGSISQAADYINVLRDRANAPNIGVADLNLDFVLNERARELYWEGHRRQDLVRFGKFTGSSYVWQWKGGSPTGSAIPSDYNLYPIPLEQLNANPNLTQNSGY